MAHNDPVLDRQPDDGDHRWMDRMACVDLDIDDMFVSTGRMLDPDVEAVCRRCPVRVQCVRRAYTFGATKGYFGGLSPSARNRMTIDEAVAHVIADSAKWRAEQAGRVSRSRAARDIAAQQAEQAHEPAGDATPDA